MMARAISRRRSILFKSSNPQATGDDPDPNLPTTPGGGPKRDLLCGKGVTGCAVDRRRSVYDLAMSRGRRRVACVDLSDPVVCYAMEPDVVSSRDVSQCSYGTPGSEHCGVW